MNSVEHTNNHTPGTDIWQNTDDLFRIQDSRIKSNFCASYDRK